MNSRDSYVKPMEYRLFHSFSYGNETTAHTSFNRITYYLKFHRCTTFDAIIHNAQACHFMNEEGIEGEMKTQTGIWKQI